MQANVLALGRPEPDGFDDENDAVRDYAVR
jgi:hypothetical protein